MQPGEPVWDVSSGHLPFNPADARALIQLLNGKWVLPILAFVAVEPRRHGQLRRLLGQTIHEKVLTETLRRMEDAGMLRRHVIPSLPPAVVYELDELGSVLLEPAAIMANWVARNLTALRTGRPRTAGTRTPGGGETLPE